jgi:phosphohistidine phosphatase
MLTSKGKARTREAAEGLRALGVAPDLILTSPFRRAVETASIAMDVLGVPEDRLVHTETLFPESVPDAFLRFLAGHAPQDVLCTGHAPHLDHIIATAIGVPGRQITHLKKAGAAQIELDQPGITPGVLHWLLSNKALRRLGARI